MYFFNNGRGFVPDISDDVCHVNSCPIYTSIYNIYVDLILTSNTSNCSNCPPAQLALRPAPGVFDRFVEHGPQIRLFVVDPFPGLGATAHSPNPKKHDEKRRKLVADFLCRALLGT